jgi:peptidoglycan hydrolase-like protein with peptidoglycan-binding domain
VPPVVVIHPSTLPVLRYGMGLKPAAPVPEVKLAQTRLRIEADGRFGTNTRTAVIEFQRRTGLAPNEPNDKLLARGFGVIREATWTKLLATS